MRITPPQIIVPPRVPVRYACGRDRLAAQNFLGRAPHDIAMDPRLEVDRISPGIFGKSSGPPYVRRVRSKRSSSLNSPVAKMEKGAGVIFTRRPDGSFAFRTSLRAYFLGGSFNISEVRSQASGRSFCRKPLL